MNIPSEYTVDIVLSGLETLKKEKKKELNIFGHILRREDVKELLKYIEDIDNTKLYVLELMAEAVKKEKEQRS